MHVHVHVPRYTLLFDNVSGSTPKRDIVVECEKCAGPVLAADKVSWPGLAWPVMS